MFIIKLQYRLPNQEMEKFRLRHREYLDYYYKQGQILASGPMNPAEGGIILVLSKDRAFVEALCQNDPFNLAQVADYEIIEFTPVKHQEAIQELILKTEGQLC